MKVFKLSAVEKYYNSTNPEVDFLKSLGFQFREINEEWMSQDLMLKEDSLISIDSLDELIKLCNDSGHSLIFSPDEISIYNGYAE